MDIRKFIETRRTYRRFTQEALPEDAVEDILYAARLSSSAANRQPLSYVVVRDPENVKTVFSHTHWAGGLPKELGEPKEGERPVMFIALIEHTDLNAKADTDAGIALSNMVTAAWEHGIGSCIMGAIDRQELSAFFGLSENEYLHTVTAFGYPSHESYVVDLSDDTKMPYSLDTEKNYVVPKRKAEDIFVLM